MSYQFANISTSNSSVCVIIINDFLNYAEKNLNVKKKGDAKEERKEENGI